MTNSYINYKKPDTLIRMRDTLFKLSEQIECNTCDLCEVGAVYVLNLEVPLMKNLNIPLVNIDGSYFIEKKGKYCHAYNCKLKRCNIYQERPICCRLFPMDIFVENDKLQWIVFGDCPIIKHRSNERSLNSLVNIAKEFENHISKEIAEEFKKEYIAWGKTGDPFLQNCHIIKLKDINLPV